MTTIKTLITPAQVIEIAFAGAPYVDESTITDADILTAQQRHILPIIGEDLMIALAYNNYYELLTDYVTPALAECVRVDCNPTCAPTTRRERLRAKAMLRLMSDYLEENQDSYSEYVSRDNILNRCYINGGFVQIL